MCFTAHLISISAPQKHRERPLGNCVGSRHPASHMAYFQSRNARSRLYSWKSDSVSFGNSREPCRLEGHARLGEVGGNASLSLYALRCWPEAA